ncbi:ribosomal protein L7/L12 C-terminal domain-containing protein [Suillus americanus]|nr:ribosomal protein L7/L12 C-terminal domain-containing protein [Suillus americanus]
MGAVVASDDASRSGWLTRRSLCITRPNNTSEFVRVKKVQIYCPRLNIMALASRCSTSLLCSSSRLASARIALAPLASRSRWLATESASSSPATPPPTDPRIGRIVDDISGLTLLQAADLVTLLKSRLNIQEIAMPAAAAAPAAAPIEEAAVEEKPKEKTIFNLKLQSFDAAAKPKIIREVKALIPNLTLIDAKKFVESVPQVLKENMPKEDADKLKEVLEKLGAVVVLE